MRAGSGGTVVGSSAASVGGTARRPAPSTRRHPRPGRRQCSYRGLPQGALGITGPDGGEYADRPARPESAGSGGLGPFQVAEPHAVAVTGLRLWYLATTAALISRNESISCRGTRWSRRDRMQPPRTERGLRLLRSAVPEARPLVARMASRGPPTGSDVWYINGDTHH